MIITITVAKLVGGWSLLGLTLTRVTLTNPRSLRLNNSAGVFVLIGEEEQDPCYSPQKALTLALTDWLQEFLVADHPGGTWRILLEGAGSMSSRSAVLHQAV